MKKADLKKKWFKYCDTNKLVDDTIELLRRYQHPTTEHGVCKLLDTYFTNKEPLIKMFMNSNHYIGNMRICLEKEFDRQIDSNEIYRFFGKFYDAVGTASMVKRQDSDGKEIFDYYIPRRAEWCADENEFYFFDNGYGWSPSFAKKYVVRAPAIPPPITKTSAFIS